MCCLMIFRQIQTYAQTDKHWMGARAVWYQLRTDDDDDDAEEEEGERGEGISLREFTRGQKYFRAQ